MPLKIKNMKGLDFSCASPASTAICSSTDQNFMVKNSTKSLNRLNSYLNNHYKTFTNNNNNHHSSTPRAPCISELPFTPRLSSSYREKTRKKPPLASIVKHGDLTPRRKSSADVDSVRRRYYEKCSSLTSSSPQHSHSSRYLLGESKFLDSLSPVSESHQQIGSTIDYSKNNPHHNNKYDNGDSLALVPSTPVYEGNNNFGSFLDAEKEKKINKALTLVNPSDQREIKSSNNGINHDNGYNQNNKQKSMGYSRNDSLVLKKSSSSGARSRDQVVVLRVSLHCKGCEGKLKKHLSKMEGVSSYSVDLETKKVTVIGNVTPVGVLTSISKVKNAQFWPSAASASPPSSSSSSTEPSGAGLLIEAIEPVCSNQEAALENPTIDGPLANHLIVPEPTFSPAEHVTNQGEVATSDEANPTIDIALIQEKIAALSETYMLSAPPGFEQYPRSHGYASTKRKPCLGWVGPKDDSDFVLLEPAPVLGWNNRQWPRKRKSRWDVGPDDY